MAGNQINVGEKKASIFRLFLIFVAVSAGLFLLMTLMILIPKFDNAFESLRDQADKTAAEKAVTTIRQYLNSRKLVLNDISSNPLITNSVLMGDGRNPAFRDFVSDAVLLGEDPKLTVLDIEGRVLFSERDAKLNYKWVLPIIAGDTPHILNVDKSNGPKFELAIPIFYIKGVEGVLVACFSAEPEKIFDNTSQEAISSAFAYGIKDRIIQSDDSAILFPHKESIFVSEFGLEFTHISDRGNVLKQKSILLRGFALSSFVIAILAFVLLFFLGRKILLHPYEELATTQKTLLKVNMELEEFSYRTSHDLKAPLINIRGLSRIMKEDLLDRDYDEVLSNLNKIERLSSNLASLTDDILEVSHIENEDEVFERINIASEMELIKEKLNTLINDKQVEVDIAIEKDKTVWTKKIVFQRILENLISNAIKYSDPEKEPRFVKLEAMNFNGGKRVVVSDNGMGIPKEYHSQLFRMFKRFHKTTSFGSGLGLYLVKKNLERIGGEISVESSPDGTTFTIFFPEKKYLKKISLLGPTHNAFDYIFQMVCSERFFNIIFYDCKFLCALPISFQR